MSKISSIIELATPGVQNLKPYVPGMPVEELERALGISGSVKLASNENPLGPSPLAVDAIKKYSNAVNHYPDGSGYKLSQRLAELHCVKPDCVTLGNGSNDILELVARVFLTPEHSAVFSKYSFAVYPIVVQAVGAKANIASAYPESHESMPLGHDPEALLSSVDDSTRVMFIANPNNPTGTWLDIDVLKKLLDDVPDNIIVVLDLAYNEYMECHHHINTASWLKAYPNLIITHTFSKIHALAGLRIGYSLCSEEIAGLLNRVRQPFNTNMLAQEAALAALDDEEHIDLSIAVNNEGKRYLQHAFDEMGLSYLPTMGNFIAVNLKRGAMPVYEKLLKMGVIVRPVGNYSMPLYLRITIGTGPQNRLFTSALAKALAD